MKAWGAALWALMGFVASAAAQDTTVYLDQGQIVRTNQNVTTLGVDLMGDKVNLYSGELEFVQTDVSLPGNNALPVAVGRRYEASKYAGSTSGGQFGDWDLEIPHLYGVFAGVPAYYKGWTVWNSAAGNVNTSRCTAFGPPVDAARTGASDAWDPDQFWNGHFLYVPGVSNERLLQRNAAFTSKPADGNTYGVVTKSNWQLRCLTTGLKVDGVAATGDGFIAVAPDGTTYRFDWMVSRWYQPLSGSPGSLSRLEHWILPTLVTDRFGNTVTYTYDTTNAWQLKSIVASDGRALNLTYVSGTNRVATVTDGSRTWTYAYSSTSPYKLTSLTLPDGSAWQFSMAEQQTKSDQRFVMNPLPTCSASNVWTEGTIVPTPLTSSITHPSGAVGSFSMSWVAHGRTFPQSTAYNPCPLSKSVSNQITPVYPVRSLTSKTLSGPGLASSVWSYGWGPANGNWYCNGCNATKTLTVTDPRSVQNRYTFSNRFQSTEGQLLQVDEGWNGSSALRTTVNTYRAFGAGPYPATVGSSGRADDGYQTSFLPLSQRTTSQQGVNFTWQATAFDTLARPTSVTRSGTAIRTETTAYADNTAKWVLGQIASVTESSTSGVMVANTYDPDTANLLSTSQFGKLQQSFSYNADGTVYRRFDAAGRATTFSNYKRGLAQNASYPDGNAESAVVHDTGVVTSTTDAAGFTTSYGYDAMGRLNQINRPSGDSVNWNATSLVFERVASAEYDLPAGHWRQTVSTGNARRITYFDGLWRAVLTKTFDNANLGGSGNDVVRRFDADGRVVYESYPTRGIGSVNSTPAGTSFVYDALGRGTQTSANSELGVLNTAINYLTGFKKQAVNPRGYATTTSYQAFDQPSEDAAVFIAAPEGLSVSIVRDVFGKPTSISRNGAYAGGTVGATRSYVYDSYQRLCKTIEPETGATVQDYDAANNVVWRATGLSLTVANNCNRGEVR